MFFKKVLFVNFLLISVSNCFAQQPDLLSKLQQYGAAKQQEKVYLHMDKPHYLTGEDIWLKGYITLGLQNQLSDLSKILYIDLLDPANNIVSSVKLLILHGVSIGDMHLSDTLQEGIYHIRAYTNWMRNSPEETFFNKSIAIGRARVDPAIIHTTFSYNAAEKQLKADVKLIGQDGFQLIKTTVKYSIVFADKVSASGTAVTDNAGNIAINFNNDKNLELKTGVLALNFTAGNVPMKRSIAVSVTRPENTTAFMPEGGDMVAGLQSKIAFKMLQPDGLGATGSGYITDETGTNIVAFTSGFAGMGSFFLIPQAGKSYKAVITYADGKKQTTDLPPVLHEGYNLTVMPRQRAFAYFALKASAAMVKNQKMTLLVQRQGTAFYGAQIAMNKAEVLIKLPMANFPSGLIQVTLFDENLQPVCERLFFNMNKKTSLPIVAQTNENYGTRKQVTVNLEAGDESDSVRIGSFSAAVVNMAGLPSLRVNEAGILPGLLLTPELKGYVENPDHYFKTVNDTLDNTRLTELDNLILCQGWRRIVWNDVKAGKSLENTFKPEKAFSVSGTVTQRNGQPAANAKVSLLATKSFLVIDTITDAKGRFVFDNLFLQETTRFAVRAKDAGDKHTLVLKLDRLAPLEGSVTNTDLQYPDDIVYQTFLKDRYRDLPDSTKQKLNNYHELKQVNVIGMKDKKKMVPAFSANLNGPGNADEIFLADEMKYSMTLRQFLEGRALGIVFNKDKPYTSRISTNRRAMKIILDGTPIPYAIDGDPSVPDDDPPTNWIPVEDVASIEIIRSVANSAVYATNDGVIIITTKTGKTENHESKASSEFRPLVMTGYHAIREFYTPDYSTVKNMTPDHRTTVFWKPDIVTDKQGKATFKFYTTDDKGTYRLCIEGITADGRPAHLVKEIKVE